MILKAVIATALFLFLAGMVARIVRIARMPLHVRWDLHPIPGGLGGKTRVMLSEIFLLRGVFRENRSLWLWSWLFHCSLYLLIGTSILTILALVSGPARSILVSTIAVGSVIAFIGGTAGTGGLIIKRLTTSRLRPFTSFAAILNLAILFAVFLSGLVHCVAEPSAANIMVKEAGSFLGMNAAPAMQPIAVAHLVLIALFAAYFPLTQMAHAVLKYFTFHSVRWDDRPACRKDAERVSRCLTYPVQWSAGHIQAGTKKPSWADVIGGAETDPANRDTP